MTHPEAATLSPAVRALLDEPNFAHVATVGRDGGPRAVMVWIDTDAGDVVLNTPERSAWGRNLRRDGRVALTVADRDEPSRYVAIRGRLTAVEHEGAQAHIDRMAAKYLGVSSYPYGRAPRILLRITPERITTL